MKFKLLLPALLVYAGNLFAQNTTENTFNTFANRQSQLIRKAYDERNDTEVIKLMSDLTVRYNQLDAANQRMYKPYINNNWYNISCLYALINKKPEALNTLDSAAHYGYSNYSHLLEDTDFNNIKNEPKFKQIAQALRAVGDYKYILQKGEKYNDKDARPVPAFNYQAANDANLVALRKQFKLDSIADKGDEASKAINLLKWVHNTVNHDGQHESGIKLINANEIISKATSQKIGVSCGELATTLNECYLAMGWKARKVYCFPKDSLNIDFDSHVINVVYLPSLKKWVWMDPTNNAYVRDEHNNLLGIAEVRQRLIDNQPLVLNEDANWNNRSKITKADYLDNYMAKNLYMVYSPLKSAYNYETRDKDRTITYVTLLPLDYFKQSPDKSENTNKETHLTIERYKTNNEAAFWKLSN
ncbi:TPR end-of-group domain-containing protein [Mucilaginibacter litoreus]|uniref:TPR end-of-group domain-containing protein n=1 Tax=Mucilaginibacter litoreus TaxID=1048221 RepID=A0ABW3ASU1_9SPHI